LQADLARIFGRLAVPLLLPAGAPSPKAPPILAKEFLVASVAAGYLPILLFLGVALALSGGFVVLPMLVSRLTGTHQPNAEKLSEYECGFPAFEDSRAQFDVRFYLIAILFIVFDLEAAFLFPWAVSLEGTGWTGWIAMMIFLAELALGLAYAWKKGALEWE
jgi:NADH-quinone oxidoreductase subunit A